MAMFTWLLWSSGGSLFLFYLLSLYFHARRVKCKSKRRLDGKTVIVTGGSSGIGRATAVNLAERGARVIIGSDQSLKGSVAAQQIRGETGNAEVLYHQLDLSDTNSIREFACHIYNTEERLDILINNAAISYHPKKVTADGYEAVFGVNYIGHFLLTYLLVDIMKRSGGGRVVNVSSMSHSFIARDLKLVVFDTKISRFIYPYLTGYEVSKLALIILSKELARRYSEQNIQANSCHPGLVLTELWKSTEKNYGKKAFQIMKFFLWPFLMKPEEACQSVVHCALCEDMDHVTGKYVKNCRVSKESFQAADTEFATSLWDLSMFLTGCPAKLCLVDNLRKRLDPTLSRRTMRDLEWWETFMHKDADPEEKQEIKRR